MQFLNDVTQKAAKFAETNAAALLTAGGVVGTVATAVLAGRGGYKYAEILAKEKGRRAAEENNKLEIVSDPKDLISPEDVTLDNWEKAKLAVPYFLPPVVVGGATIASIIMSNRVSAQKAAALAAAYGLAERNLSEYKEKVQEKLTGPKKKAIEEEISQDRVNRSEGYQNVVIVDGEVLCFDEPTGRYFRSTMEKIKQAVNETNAEILNDRGWVNATAFYERLGMPATSWTDDMGWNTDELVELKFDTVTSPDGRPCIAVDFQVLPKPDYIPKHY